VYITDEMSIIAFRKDEIIERHDYLVWPGSTVFPIALIMLLTILLLNDSNYRSLFPTLQSCPSSKTCEAITYRATLLGLYSLVFLYPTHIERLLILNTRVNQLVSLIENLLITPLTLIVSAAMFPLTLIVSAAIFPLALIVSAAKVPLAPLTSQFLACGLRAWYTIQTCRKKVTTSIHPIFPSEVFPLSKSIPSVRVVNAKADKMANSIITPISSFIDATVDSIRDIWYIISILISTISSFGAVVSIFFYGACCAHEVSPAIVVGTGLSLVGSLFLLRINIVTIVEYFRSSDSKEGAVPSVTQNGHRPAFVTVFLTAGIRVAALIGLSYHPVHIDEPLWWCAILMTIMPVIQWTTPKDSNPWSFPYCIQILSSIISKCMEIYFHVLVFHHFYIVGTSFLFPG
jgi:hypothetical protein